MAHKSRTCARARPRYGGIFDYPAKAERLRTVNAALEDPAVWSDPKKAQELSKEKKSLEGVVSVLDGLERNLADSAELYDLGKDEGDAATLAAVAHDVAGQAKMVEELEFRRMFHQPADPCNCFLDIQAGAGGTEAQDWVEILMRMYLRWAEKKGFKTEILDYLAGDEAGTKSVTIMMQGRYAYGYMRSELGIHRLVRISPFDASGRRHTSFASVMVIPELDDTITVDIDEKELRIDTYRSSGAGGQHVNKTDSAIRITHLPTGIVVQCQNERSQHSNKAMAMKMLTARLYELERQKQAETHEGLVGDKKDIAWGSQIRSYVLQPYRLIKDHRTDHEVGNVEAVLDGELDPFIKTYLLWRK